MPGFMPSNPQQDHAGTDIVIWSTALVFTMIELLEVATMEGRPASLWGVPAWRRVHLQHELLLLLDRERAGWIIADVPIALLDELRPLRVEAYRRIGC